MLNLSAKPRLRKIILILLCALFFTVLIWFIFTFRFLSWDFRNELWAPSYLLWHRESAYNTTVLFPISLAVWFPQIIGVFFPLGLLSLDQATNIWLVMNIALLVYLTWSLTMRVSREGTPRLYLLSALLIAVFLYPPTFRLLRLGQVDIVMAAAIIAGTYALENRHLTVGAFLYTLALTKPQLTLVVLPSLAGYWLFVKKDWHYLLKFSLMTGFFILVLSIPLWLSNPKWMADFLSNLSTNPNWVQPSIFFKLYSGLGAAGVAAWLVLYASALILALWLWKEFGSFYGVLWSLALTTLVSPYIWSWDFVLLLPLLIDSAARLTTNASRLSLFGFYTLSLVLSAISLQSSPNAGDEVLWWFPLVILAGIILSLKLSIIKRNC